MAPQPSMPTVDANTNNRARFIGSSTNLECRSLALGNLRYRIFRYRNSSMTGCPHDNSQVSGEARRAEHQAARRAAPRTRRAERRAGVPVSYTHLRAHETRHDLV